MITINKLLALSLLIVFYSLNAQEKKGPRDYGKYIVNTLASDEFAGRGYVYDGLNKSADFISEQFKKIGLKPINGQYEQPVTYPINVIKDSKLEVNGKPLKFGMDYLVGVNSVSGSGNIKPLYFNTDCIDTLYLELRNKYFFNEIDRLAGKSAVFPYHRFPEHYVGDINANAFYDQITNDIVFGSYEVQIPVVFKVTPGKLTHSLAAYPSKNTTSFYISSNAVPEKIEEVNYEVQTEFVEDFKTKNIFGKIDGKSDSIIVISAHYDHLGQVGDAIFTGANDNASGIAFMLALAKTFSLTPPPYTMVFIAFTGEEAGLQGSKTFVENPPFPLEKIKFVYNFDIMGTGDDGIQIVNSKNYPEEFERLEELNDKLQALKNVKYRANACNSDHCPFTEKGIPAWFIYTLGGVSYYHDVMDKPETLPLTKFEDILTLWKHFILNLK